MVVFLQLELANVSDIYEEDNEEIIIVVKWKQTDVHKFQIRRVCIC